VKASSKASKRVSLVASARGQKEGARLAEAPEKAPGRSRYVVMPLPAELRSTRPPLDKPNPRIGIGAPVILVAVGRRSALMPFSSWFAVCIPHTVYNQERMDVKSKLLPGFRPHAVERRLSVPGDSQ
jgi:hypothetical protein